MMTPTPDSAAFEAMRHAMVASQLRTTAVNDVRVVDAMSRVPRELFVPADVRPVAYRDTAIPLGGGRFANVPMATGRLLTEAGLRADDRVLLIGAAGGYTAAVLAEIVREVIAVESDAALLALARAALGEHRPTRGTVTLVDADLAKGHPDAAPYDLLVVDGAVEHLPDALVAQVRREGRVVSGIAERGVTRLARGVRTDGGFALAPFADVDCVSLPGFATPPAFTF